MRRILGSLVLLGCAGCAAILGEPIHSPPTPERPVPAAPEPAPPEPPPAAAAAPVTAPAKPRRLRPQGDTRPDSYVVQRGDTLFAIALDFGLDYRELAVWNGIADPSRILAGQRLRLLAPEARDETAPRGEVSAVPAGQVQGPRASDAAAVRPGAAVADAASEKVPVLAEPRAVTLPWSEKAFAQLGGDNSSAAKTVSGARPPETAAAVASPAAEPSTAKGATGEEDWTWPARGTLAYRFGGSGALKGLGIAGAVGSPVLAAAPGRVVYSGSGLRGYGKLVIIKHNEEFLTVYAHNQSLLVKEGEQVKRGQPIAAMGDSDSDRVALHFEMRRYGRPVDPLTQLPGERPPS